MSSTLCSNTRGSDHNPRARRQRCDACTHTIPVRPPDPIQTLAGRQQTHHQAGNTVTLPPVLRLGSRPDLACLAPSPDERRDTSARHFTAQHVDDVIARAREGGGVDVSSLPSAPGAGLRSRRASRATQPKSKVLHVRAATKRPAPTQTSQGMMKAAHSDHSCLHCRNNVYPDVYGRPECLLTTPNNATPCTRKGDEGDSSRVRGDRVHTRAWCAPCQCIRSPVPVHTPP
jgi:hypothetical protein